MSSLFGLLNNGATGLHAHGFGMQVASQNAQNASTEGYTRRDVRLSPIAPPPDGGGGVRAGGSRRVMDRFLERRLLGATSSEAEATARQGALGVLDRVLSEAEGGLASSLDDFEVALSELSGRPSDPGTREAVLAAAERLSGAFAGTAREIERTRQDLDAQIALEVDQVNGMLRSIGELGQRIQRAEVGGQEASDLRDRRDQLVRDLSEKLPVTTVDDPDGGQSVLLGGSLALVTADGRASQLDAQPDASGRMRLTRETAGADRDVTALAESGAIGGLVAARDGALADAEASLDQLAFDVATAYNGAHQAGYGTDGLNGRDLFAAPTGVDGAAAAFSVSTDVAGRPDRVAAAQDPALAAGDNRNALALAGLADADLASGGTATSQEALGSLIASAGHAIQGASRDAEHAGAAMAQLGALRESVSGVSVDEEMIALNRYQRGYQASLRVVQAADDMLAELVNLGR
ncbi:MAG TPA: flagellar hook-associated protein FlgK [Sandaracinaceae bacterium LLY-WYZ-13_1]|nr:flagellar hook-associated protein FlgK [Sandaracinaceae bacterium LLY-WYZ-13_1]